MTVETPENVSNSSHVTDAPKETENNSKSEDTKKAPEVKVSPAQDLRDIQGLLVNGIFPGQVAPAVVKAYQILEQMAVKIERASTEVK